MRLHLLSVLLLGLAACNATTTTRTDEQLGNSMNMLKALQVVNADAPRNPDPVKGVDGKAARSAMESYRDSFQKPEAQPASISIFGGGAGSGTTGK